MISRRAFLAGAGGMTLSLASGPARAGVAPVCATSGLALRGHDPVAYFANGRPTTGHREYALRWRGAIWLFENLENMIAFEMNPKGFAPRFGGYCSFGMAGGQVIWADPNAWTIHNHRLYLMSSAEAHDRWLEHIPQHVAAAEQEWKALLHG